MFSRTIIASALMGFAAAQSSLPIAASESLLASATEVAGSMSTAAEAAAAAPGAAVPAGMVATHVVQVGGANGSLAFFPNNVKAAAGDLVQFQFHPKNHSVVRSTFDNPCVPMNNVMANASDAFFSGFMPTNASLGATANVLTFTIHVKDTKPIWFYCGQAKHCQAGMVGAINAPASGNRTMESFIALAAKAPETLNPGQAAGSGSGAGNTPPTPSGGAGAGGSGTSGGNAPGSSTGSNPAQQSTSKAPALAQQSFFGLAAAALVAFVML